MPPPRSFPGARERETTRLPRGKKSLLRRDVGLRSAADGKNRIVRQMFDGVDLENRSAAASKQSVEAVSFFKHAARRLTPGNCNISAEVPGVAPTDALSA